MTVRVGVIGAGMMGQDHIRRISRVLTGGAVVAVNDVDAARAGQVAAGLPGAAVHATAQDLIGDGDVDAVLVASWGPAHEEQVLAAIGAGKPVFCEKPLAPSSGACLRIVDAEVAQGRRCVQVGFMRRYDAGYQAMKAALEDGSIGAPLLMHCAHRNPSVPPYGFTTEMIISDSAVHEIDLVRHLRGLRRRPGARRGAPPFAVVSRASARPAMAAHAESIRHLDFRGHAPADDRRGRREALEPDRKSTRL